MLLHPRGIVLASDAASFLDEALPADLSRANAVVSVVMAGARADRLGFAFAAGYVAALAALLGRHGASPSHLRRACVAATEMGGGHPRAIATSLTPDGDGYRLDGEKSWVTLGRDAELAIVIAKVGEANGRPLLRAVALPTNREGVAFEDTPAPPFAPEISHAKLVLRAVRVDEAELLAGDGYADWLKPFRTIEDIHVHAALVGYLGGAWGRAGAGSRVAAELVAVAGVLVDLAARDENAASTHVALDGALGLVRDLGERHASCWGGVSQAEKARWERDRALLDVAGRARAERFSRAIERLSG